MKDKVLESIDIVEVIGERVVLTRRGKEFIGLCPFHPDHKPSMSVNPTKQIFKCWSCGAGGDVIKFVQLRERVDFREALSVLAKRAGIDARIAPVDRQTASRREQYRKALTWARTHFQDNLHKTPGGRKAFEYARRRGLSDETIQQRGLGHAAAGWDNICGAAGRAGLTPDVLQQAGLTVTNDSGRTYDRFRDRLIFPICDALGRPVAFGGRALGDDPAKYLNSPETALFSKSRVLYGLDVARRAIERHREAIVVEGYMDAVLLYQHGFEHVVATLGTALTDAHVKLIRPLADSLILCFDGDQAGVLAAERAVETALRNRITVRVVVLEPGQDPADCVVTSGASGFKAALNTATEALQFKWRLTVRTLGAAGERGRRAAVEEYLRFVGGVSAAGGIDPLEQGLLVARLSELLSLPAATVYELLARARSDARRSGPSPANEAPNYSDYESAVRGLPTGLVVAVEDVFGVMLADAGAIADVGDAFDRAIGYCDTWKRLSATCCRLAEESGEYTRADVVENCDEAALCELVSRASARVKQGALLAEVLRSAYERLVSELDLLRMGDLRVGLRQTETTDADADEAFRAFLDVARRQHAVLAAEERWNTTNTP
ncbi:MAG: DNA primase [Planctomycetes bacterium]|nr:DNA primase [Planctomycetota bacterium]